MLVDAHCHIDLYNDPYSVAQRAESSGIITIAVTNLPSHFELGHDRVKRLKHVRMALGLHPLMVEKHNSVELMKFKDLLRYTSYIGEVGLDLSRKGKETIEKQVKSFRFVLKAIRESPRYISLHSRGAEKIVLDLLCEHGIKGATFHWYSGPLGFVDDIVDAGNYFSINPRMIRSKKGQDIIRQIPIDRILSETDGPFIRVGKRPIRPSDVNEVIKFLSNLWGTTLGETEEQVFRNFIKIIDPIKKKKIVDSKT